MNLRQRRVPRQAYKELQLILSKPYKDVCNLCVGEGRITARRTVAQATCPKCNGSGQRLLRLL